MDEIATSIMNWETIEDAALYFKGQEREPTLVNKYELHSLEKLRKKLGCTSDALVQKIIETNESK